MDMLLTAVPWTAVGPGSVLVLAVVALIRGDLVPRKTHEEIVVSEDRALEIERTNSAELRAALSEALRRESHDAKPADRAR